MGSEMCIRDSILGGGDGGSVLYGQEANDLTDEIVKLLNDKYKK